MNQTKRTLRDIQRFIMTAAAWQSIQDNQKQSHLKYAISRVMPGCQKIQNDFENEMVRINIENGRADDKGNIMLNDNGEPLFTKEGLQKRNTESHKLLDDEYEFGTYFATIVPNNLTPAQEAAFEGFVIKPLEEPQPAQ